MKDADIEWRVSEDFVILWEAWGEDTLIYHSGSGQTHLLNEIAVYVLQFLQHGQASCSSLLSGLDENIEGGLNDSIRQHVRALLDRFERLGLVEVSTR